jgi:HEAT repeat protein
MRGSFARVLLFALMVTLLFASGWADCASGQPKVDPKKDPVAADTTKVGTKTLEICIKELALKDVSRREGAIRFLVLFPPQTSAKAIPALLDELVKLNSVSGDLSVRTSICTVLAEIFRNNDKIDPFIQRRAALVLKRSLHDPQVVMRFRAAQTLAAIGPEARSAIPELVGLLRDPATWEIRQAAAQALGTIGHDKQTGPNIDVLRALYAELGDSAFQVRLASIQSLTYLGPPGDKAGMDSYLKSLKSIEINDPEMALKIWARCAVAYAQQDLSAEMLGPIGKLMSDPDAIVRTQALQAMGSLGPKGQSTLRFIRPCLGDKDNMVKLTAIWAVGQMGGSSIMAIDKLQMIIADPKEDAATKAIAKQSLDKINKGK